MSTTKEATRTRLLEAARKLLLERGFHGVGLEDIAEAAGVSRQAVYKSHFTSKAELLLALVQYVHVAEKLDELTAPVFAAESGVAMLHETIRAIVLIQTRVHALAMVLSAAALSDAGARAAWHDRKEVERSAFRAALNRTRKEGQLSDGWKVEQATEILMSLISVDTYERLVVEHGWKPAAMVERIWELCCGSFVKLAVPPAR